MVRGIGFLDSGVGGLGVLSETLRLLPNGDFLYLADHAWAPYGTRQLAEVSARCHDLVETMIERGCEIVVIACNTASAAALHDLRSSFPGTAFVGMEPAIKPAAAMSGRRRLGVVATAATFQGALFASVVDRFADGREVVTAACPGWVDLVERGAIDSARARAEVAECLVPLTEAGVDVVVLACTHFPALRPMIEEVMGPGVSIIDPAPAVARRLAAVAGELGLEGGSATVVLLSTGDPVSLDRAALRHGIRVPAALLPLP